jgi:hypothetical protein
MTKIDLILLSRERGINIEGFSKQQIIEALEKQQK